jgi:hypothetical protein
MKLTMLLFLVLTGLANSFNMDSQRAVALNNVHLKILLKKMQKDEDELVERIQNLKEENERIRDAALDEEFKVQQMIKNDCEFYKGEISHLVNSKVFEVRDEIELKIRELERKVEEKKDSRSHLIVWACYLAAFFIGFGLFKAV